jgi:predicted ester cyclase
MAARTNREIALGYLEGAWVTGRGLGDFVAECNVRHLNDENNIEAIGLAELIERNMYYHSVFSDWKMNVLDAISEDDKIAIRFRLDLTHIGEWHCIAPRHKRFAVNGVDIFRIADGKIVEKWAHIDLAGVEGQLRSDG